VLDRPSVETGSRYKQVSEAYISAVHSVLISKRGASEAAADLEKQLIQITGFPTGAPKTGK
jgi:trehalose/maltose transport system substrate-binding protein